MTTLTASRPSFTVTSVAARFVRTLTCAALALAGIASAQAQVNAARLSTATANTVAAVKFPIGRVIILQQYSMIALPMDTATDMNASGLIVGSKDGQAAAYVNGTVHPLQSPQGYTDVIAWAVSSNGIIVGTGISAGATRPLRWNSYQSPAQDLGANAKIIQPLAVNSSGVIVGYSLTSENASPHAFRYSPSTWFQDIHPSGWSLSQAFHVSESGFIAGFTNGGLNDGYAARWYPNGGVGSIARGYGQYAFEDGRILGIAQTDAGQVSRMWDVSNTIIPVGPNPATHFVKHISGNKRMVGVTNDTRAWTNVNGSAAAYLPTPAGNYSTAIRVTGCGAILGSYGTAFNFKPALWTKQTCDLSDIVAAF